MASFVSLSCFVNRDGLVLKATVLEVCHLNIGAGGIFFIARRLTQLRQCPAIMMRAHCDSQSAFKTDDSHIWKKNHCEIGKMDIVRQSLKRSFEARLERLWQSHNLVSYLLL